MYRISVILFVFGFLIGSNMGADDSQPDCGNQYLEQFKCMMAIKEGDEIKTIMEKKKPILQTCAPDYPKSCLEEFDTMQTCCKKLSSKWQDDPECVALSNDTIAKVNKCFATEPHNPLADLEELFMPPGMGGHHHHRHGKGPMDMMHGGGGPGGEKSGEKSKGGEGKEKGEPKKDKREVKANETSSSNEESEEDSGPPPPPFKFRKECMKSKSQMECVGKELSKSDASFQKAIESLMQKKDDCDAKVKHVCKLSSGPLKKCFWEAHENLFKKIYEKMDSCMKGGSDGGKGKDEGTTTEKPKDDGTTEKPKEKASRK